MKYSRIPYVEKEVSKIFFGTAADAFQNGENCDELLDGMVALGINAIDTARVYGLSERSIGDWMKRRGNRDQLVLLSKCCHPLPDGTKRVSAEVIEEDFKTSCRLLGTDYIDIYLLHRDDPNVPVKEIVDTLNEMHKNGQIGAFGGSNWTAKRIKEANDYALSNGLIPFTVTSPNLCLAEQVNDMFGGGCVSLSGPSGKKDREYYSENDIAVVSYSSIGRGLFSGKLKSDEWEKAEEVLDEFAYYGYVCEENRERLRRCEELSKKKNTTVPIVAMAWVFAQKMNVFAVVGTQKVERMRSNIAALDLCLSEEELAYLENASDKTQ